MADQVVVNLCHCQLCVSYRERFSKDGKTDKFDFNSVDVNFKFPQLEDPDGNSQVIGYGALAAILECKDPSPTQRKQNVAEVIRFLTYLNLEKGQLSLQDFIIICEYVYNEDLESIIEEGTAAAHFLCQISKIFVITWYALAHLQDESAEWAARKIRRFLVHILQFPIIAGKVITVFFLEQNWRIIGPTNMVERMCKDSLNCMDTVSLLVNLMRIEDVPDYFDRQTKCVQIIIDQFEKCCSAIQSDGKLGGLLLMLFMNLTGIEEFVRFLMESNDGYFMNIVLVDVMAKPDSCEAPRNTVWPFIRNLSLREKGRKMIMENLELYLGHLLYPIAGPEKLEVDESSNLPLELAELHETKTRVEDKRIREYILDTLYSLCRYRKDRNVLRKADIYQVLKHYHLAEDDPNLISKIEDVVNVLIRMEESEIEVDDLMEGLSIGPPKSDAGSLQICVKLHPVSFLSPVLSEKDIDYLKDRLLKRNCKVTAHFKIVAEDEEHVLSGSNPCTLETLPSDTKKFCYYKFFEFHRLKTISTLAELMKRKLVNREKGVKKNLYDRKYSGEPSEKYMKDRISELYGPVDYDDPLMQKRMRVICETIMEMDAMQPEDPEYMLTLMDENIDIKDPLNWSHVLMKKINEEFTHEEIVMYGKPNPLTSEGDWFVLPRPAPNEIPNIGSASTPNVLTNLHVYDPKLEYCFKLPYRIFKKDEESVISRMLSFRILEHINSFPFGVTSALFWEKFLERYCFTPMVWGIPSLNAVLNRHAEEMYVVKEDQNLLFPGLLEGIVHPNTILKRLWHAIKCLLGRNLYLPADEILQLIKNNYGFEFNPRHWDFQDVNDLLNFLIDKFGHTDLVHVHRVNYSENSVMKFKDYLTYNSQPLREKLESLHGVSSLVVKVVAQQKRSTRIPKGCLRENSTIRFNSDKLMKEITILADLKTIHDPERMIIIEKEDLTKLWDFHLSLQQPSMTGKFIFENAPDPRRVKIGMYLMAFLKWGYYGPAWFRVKILWGVEENSYLVYGVDFGFMEYATLKDMRYMPRKDIGEEIAHAIPIKLFQVDHPSGIKDAHWERVVVNRVMNKFIKDGDLLLITLVEAHRYRLFGCRRWTVRCDVIDETTRDVLQTEIESQFPNEFLKELIKWRKENEESAKKSKAEKGK